jgi:hypothetical protein
VKEEVKKAVDIVTRKVEREVKSLKDETAIFKGKAEELEQRLNRVLKFNRLSLIFMLKF